MKTDDIVPLGSMTKAYTTMAIMRLVEAGKMGLNDTIVEHAD
jgi:CubicO group peptidase (beta-lactamase class C family)